MKLSFWIFLFTYLGASSSLALAELGDDYLHGTNSELEAFVVKNKGKLGPKAVLGISVLDWQSGETVYASQSDTLLIPASVQKILTSIVALKVLGTEFRYRSHVFVEILPSPQAQNSKVGYVGNLYFQGSGDPSLVTERLWLVAQELSAKGVRTIEHLVLDDTLFIDPPQPSGPRAYQAGASAVPLNHNSISVTVEPTGEGRKAVVYLSAGVPYEVVNKVVTKGRVGNKLGVVFDAGKAKQGNNANTQVVVSGWIGREQPTVTFYQSVPRSDLYFLAVFKNLLRQAGISILGESKKGKTPEQAHEILISQSENLEKIIQGLNRFSNNFTAEQVVYTLGRREDGQFDRGIGLEKMRKFLRHLGFSERSFSIFDGSGLNRGNRLTSGQLSRALVYAGKDFSITPVLVSSLSQYGKSGTLKKRKLRAHQNRPEFAPSFSPSVAYPDSIWAKTGTLDGVSSLAGYLGTKSGKRVAFTIIINGARSKHEANLFEDGFLEQLLDL